MKKRYLYVISLLFFFLLFFLNNLLFAQTVMNIELKDIDGNYVTIDDLKGSELTVLDFWATWCKPCVKSIPELVKLSKEYEEDKVAFVGINEDSPRNLAKVRPFSNSLGISYPVLLDTEQEIYNELLVSVLPTLIIMNGEGEILYTHEGYTRGDEKVFKEKIEEFLSNDE